MNVPKKVENFRVVNKIDLADLFLDPIQDGRVIVLKVLEDPVFMKVLEIIGLKIHNFPVEDKKEKGRNSRI